VRRAATQTLTLGPASVALNERPTVFYAPVEGEKFVRQMMTPINPDTLIMLVRSGWSIDRLFSVAVQTMNGLRNAPSASGPTPSYEPEFMPFRDAIRLLRVLQREHYLEIAPGPRPSTVELHFLNEQAHTDTALRLKQLLRLHPELDHFTLSSEPIEQDGRTVVIATRPLMAALNFLSQGVEAAPADIAAGKVRTTVRQDGRTPFDWQELLGGTFRVRSSPTPPASASVAVHYRDAWFYIPDDDLDSKSTFVLVTQLIALHSTPPKAGPALSYSVGG